MIRARTKSPEDTRALAAELAPLARAGDVILLAGDLGSGKTVFVKGFGRALGVTEPITSPTFTLVRCYEGDLPLVHVDVYRLDHLQEVVELGISELLDSGMVAVVEWGDVVAPTLPADFLEVRLEFGDADDERSLQIRAVGPTWSAKMAAVARALDQWSVEP